MSADAAKQEMEKREADARDAHDLIQYHIKKDESGLAFATLMSEVSVLCSVAFMLVMERSGPTGFIWMCIVEVLTLLPSIWITEAWLRTVLLMKYLWVMFIAIIYVSLDKYADCVTVSAVYTMLISLNLRRRTIDDMVIAALNYDTKRQMDETC